MSSPHILCLRVFLCDVLENWERKTRSIYNFYTPLSWDREWGERMWQSVNGPILNTLSVALPLGVSFLIVVFRSNLFLPWLMMNWSFHFRSPIDASAGSSNWHRAIRCERMDARTAAQKISHRLDIYERGPGHIMHRCMWMHFASYPCMLHACNEQDMDFSNLVVANLCNLVIDVMLGNVLRSRSASTCRHTSRSMAKPIRPTRHEMHQRSQTGYGMHGQIFFDEFLY